MKTLVLTCASLLAMALSAVASPVNAQTLGWVSPTGNDANNCLQTAPCATFAGVIGKGGFTQIHCLGSGFYGALNAATLSITSSIVIDCGAGNVGEMANSGLAGVNALININASSDITVVLRHLSLNGTGAQGINGVFTQSFPSGTLIIEDCTIHEFSAGGIVFSPSDDRGTLVVTHSLLYGNGGETIKVVPFSGQIAQVAINGTEIINGGDGLSLQGAGTVVGTVRHSLLGFNAGAGIIANAAGGVFLTVEKSTIIDNLDFGILTDSTAAKILVGGTTIRGNGIGVKVRSGGSILSFGNNQISPNGDGMIGNFTGTVPLQ